MADEKKTRFEVRLTPERRAQLEQLSTQIGVSAPDLARLAITQLLANRDTLLTGRAA